MDLDLAEYAGAGPSTQRYILQVQFWQFNLDCNAGNDSKKSRIASICATSSVVSITFNNIMVTNKKSLQAYDTSHRLDNSLLQITLNITLRWHNSCIEVQCRLIKCLLWSILADIVCLSREGDLVFSRPLTRTQVHTTQDNKDQQNIQHLICLATAQNHSSRFCCLVKKTGDCLYSGNLLSR